MYHERKVMFRAAPFSFLILVLLIPIGIGLIALLWWYVSARSQTLEVAEGRVTFRRGVLSREQIELQVPMIRSVRVEQSLMQRMFGVGDAYITSSGSSPEIVAPGMPHIKLLRGLLTDHRAAY